MTVLDTVSQLGRLADIDAIKTLKGLYCHCVAIEDWATFETLFAEDLEFISPGGGSLSPRSAFMDFHRENIQRPKLWGVVRCFTPIIKITGENSATGIWALEDYHVWPGDGPPIGHRGFGHYHEKYVRFPEGWRFRKIRVAFDRLEPLAGGFGSSAK